LTEKEIENDILKFLNMLPATKAWKNQSVGIFDPVKKVYRMNKGAFTAKGSSDILGICNGVMLCIEVKSAKGKPTQSQLDFIDIMNHLGALAFIARSVDDVKKELFDNYLIEW